MKVLITGSSGFVGRHFYESFKEHELVGVDIKEGNDCRNFFRNNSSYFDLVIHCAAVVGGRTMIERSPLHLAAEDLSIDAELWRWAIRTEPGRIVYFSSSAAYPIHTQMDGSLVRQREDDIVLSDVRTPDFSYGWVKLTGEQMARYAESFGLRVHVFRPFSGYGADQDLDYPFPSFVRRGVTKMNPFPIWGDGEQVRDWVHISDIVGAVCAAIDNDVKGPTNICSGFGVSFNELAKLVMNANGYQGDLAHDLSAPVGARFRVGDPTKMLSFYTPKVSLLQGVLEAMEMNA